MAADTCIPGMTEALVDVYVERSETDDQNEFLDCVVEAAPQFTERYSLLLASTLVDVNAATTCKIRMLNPMPDNVVLKQETEVGMAERSDSIVSVIAESESADDDNVMTVQRLRMVKVSPIDEETSKLPRASAAEVPSHLENLYKTSISGRTPAESEIIAGVLTKFSSTFSRDDWDLGLTHLTEHSINTGDAAPVKQRPRRVPMAYAEDERKAIDELLQMGVIRKSTSPWASPIVLVRKKSGAVRPCVDYRKLNELVKPDGFPLPRVQDCLDAVAGSSLFSSLDLTSGYFQVPLKPEDVPKSAFVCKYGQYEMLRLPFGLNSACGTFQRLMELTLQGLQWITCLVYIDDVIVHGRSFHQHMHRLVEVLQRICNAGLKLKPDKCRLLQPEVVFLGHVVSGDGVRPDPTNVDKVINWPQPETSKQVKQFVATASYYRRFVRDFAKIARPLIELTKIGKEFLWSTACQDAFSTLKEKLTSPPVMGYPRNDAGDFLLDVDASGVGIGGVLAQIQDEQERVISYGSRALNKAERNYCVTEKELLAVVFSCNTTGNIFLGDTSGCVQITRHSCGSSGCASPMVKSPDGLKSLRPTTS